MSEEKKKLTIVVPVYNEEDNIEHFAQAVHKALDNLNYDYTLLFVDDGSVDSSRLKIRIMEKLIPASGIFFFTEIMGIRRHLLAA